MKSVRSAKAAPRHRKSEAPRDRAAVDMRDRVLIASMDSFPASDPPGWIEGNAHPSEEPAPVRRKR
jgi:hypothetical protein